MRINKLTVTNLRGYTRADFDFQPGMNLLVGVNGVGKTTVLDAIRICMSRVLPEVTASNNRKEAFTLMDVNIMAEKKNLLVSCDVEWNSQKFNITQSRPESTVVPDKEGQPREQVIEIDDAPVISPSLDKLYPGAKKSKTQPLVIFFSTRRSLFIEEEVRSAPAGQAAAYSEALNINRESNLRLLADWYHAQQALGEESPKRLRHIAVLSEAVRIFMPGFDNLTAVKSEKAYPQFLIDKNGIPLNVRYQLSDGERGMLALVLELAKRLSQANPEMDNPLEGEGIVLIDELDLHLHPKWQRTIVENLERTFPNIQFIATTHSPQVIPSVYPIKIQLIDRGEVLIPERSYGMDSNWILRHLMEGYDRPEFAIAAITEVEKLIDEVEFEKAREKMEAYRNDGLDLQYWSILGARIARLETFDDED